MAPHPAPTPPRFSERLASGAGRRLERQGRTVASRQMRTAAPPRFARYVLRCRRLCSRSCWTLIHR